MGFQAKISYNSVYSKPYKNALAGIASINIDQKMRYAKKSLASGSLGEDWRLVGKDIANAITSAKKG
jgi:hypothetical protein